MSQEAPGPVVSLGDLCLSCVCRSLDQLCDRRADGSLRLRRAPRLPPETADLLLNKMAVEGRPEQSGSSLRQDQKLARVWNILEAAEMFSRTNLFFTSDREEFPDPEGSCLKLILGLGND